MRYFLSTVCMLCVVQAASCADINGKVRNIGGLTGTKWKLSGWSDSSLDPSRFDITAEFSESQISGTSAVNSYVGRYTATADGVFSIEDLQSTLIGGSDDAMHAESVYFELLQKARKFTMNKTTLTLSDTANRDILIFHAR